MVHDKSLVNAKKVLRDFEKEYGREIEDIRQQERKENKRIYDKGKLPRRYTAKTLFGWNNKRYCHDLMGGHDTCTNQVTRPGTF